jgi:hypothetical protein
MQIRTTSNINIQNITIYHKIILIKKTITKITAIYEEPLQYGHLGRNINILV